MKRIFAALIVMMSTTVWASNFEDGFAAYKKGDYAKALTLFKAAALEGSLGAQYNLGYMYSNGKGIAQDYAEAVRWYKLAAEQGDAGAQRNLGVLYNLGKGVPQDYASAILWYQLASAQGDSLAQYNLGAMHYYGHGVLQDYVKAYMWSNLASAQDDKTAMELRDAVKRDMTPQQIAEAQKLARECLSRNYKDCD